MTIPASPDSHHQVAERGPASLDAQRQDLLDFYRRNVGAARAFRWATVDGGSTSAHGEPVWIPARMLHSFALAALDGDETGLDLAGRALDQLHQRHADPAAPGWFWNPAVHGAHKRTYGHVFVVLGAAAAHRAGLPAAALLRDGLALITDGPAVDPGCGLLADDLDERLRPTGDFRSQNCNMHAVEALLAARDLGVPGLDERILQTVQRLVLRDAEAHDWRVVEHYTDRWQPITNDRRIAGPVEDLEPGWVPGHGLEWAKLLCQVSLAFPRHADTMLHAARALFARALADGWGAGGLALTCGWSGAPLDRTRVHWPLTEGVGASWYLWTLTGEEVYHRWWQVLSGTLLDDFADHTHGGWYYRLADVDSGKPDLYHAIQATWYATRPVRSSTLASVCAASTPRADDACGSIAP
jgi:mannose/cellobiose epimerase-like protein (N-acyl-D-glucosamine 2-epimerase family)